MTLRVAMIGYGFMGAAHSVGWRQAPRVFDLPARVEMAVVVGRNPDAVAAAAAHWGWAESATDWREVVARDDIDVVDIVTPGEPTPRSRSRRSRPASTCSARSRWRTPSRRPRRWRPRAARAEGRIAMVGFTYRRVPAVTLLRDLVAEGRIGRVQQVRAAYRQDWLVDASVPLGWRLQKEHAGSGALGDIGAHIVDMTQFVTGQAVQAVAGTVDTFVRRAAPGRRASRVHRARPATRSARSPSTTWRSSRAALERRRPRVVRGDALRDRPEERPHHRGVRRSRRARLRPRAAQRAAASTTGPRRPRARGSRRSS